MPVSVGWLIGTFSSTLSLSRRRSVLMTTSSTLSLSLFSSQAFTSTSYLKQHIEQVKKPCPKWYVFRTHLFPPLELWSSSPFLLLAAVEKSCARTSIATPRIAVKQTIVHDQHPQPLPRNQTRYPYLSKPASDLEPSRYSSGLMLLDTFAWTSPHRLPTPAISHSSHFSLSFSYNTDRKAIITPLKLNFQLNPSSSYPTQCIHEYVSAIVPPSPILLVHCFIFLISPSGLSR